MATAELQNIVDAFGHSIAACRYDHLADRTLSSLKGTGPRGLILGHTRRYPVRVASGGWVSARHPAVERAAGEESAAARQPVSAKVLKRKPEK